VDAARPRSGRPARDTAPLTAEQWLGAEATRRLEDQVQVALRRARSSGKPILVSVRGRAVGDVDPTAAVVASRRPGEPWFCFEQRDRDNAALGALGGLRRFEASGAERFAQVASRWRGLCAAAMGDLAGGPPGSGLVAVGGFAFSPEGGAGEAWSGFSPASLVVPELSLSRRGGETVLTLNVDVAPDDTVADALRRAMTRLSELRHGGLPLLDPAPTGSYRVHSPMPPSHYEEAVARAVERIRRGEFEKIVLAREVEVHAPIPHDPGAILGLLRQEFPSCYVFAVGRGEATFLAASPELLVRRDGQRASTVALAGSIGRSADPAVDDHLGERLRHSDKDREENAIVARRIARTLSPLSVWTTAAPEPVLVRVANIQHLATPIRAQLAAPMGAIELAGALHPTPAVGGEPRDRVGAIIPALEGIDRGWYAGAVGWADSSGDGEFCVALRCALLRGALGRLYAGCGIVRDSDPADELAETEVKLSALLPALAG
jgi:menaquinone-specific isochorismate synthase